MKVNIIKHINSTQAYIAKESENGDSFVDKSIFHSYLAKIDDMDVIINSCPEGSCFDIDLCDERIKGNFIGMLNRNMENLRQTLEGVNLNEGDLFKF